MNTLFSKKNRIVACFIGPLPKYPNRVGGPTISFKLLCDYMDRDSNLDNYIINTSRNSKNFFGNYFHSILAIFKYLKIRSVVDVVMINMSPRGMISLGYIIVKLTSKKCKVVVRFFGSSIDNVCNENDLLKQKILSYLFKKELVLLQTKGLVEFCKEKFPFANIAWFPTSRSLISNEFSKIENFEQGYSSKIKFVFVGHLKPSKGILLLRDAVLKLNHLGYDNMFIVDLYGDFRDGLCENSVSIKNLSYKGYIKPGDTIEVLKNYDVLVFPTFHEGEGYPGVIIEAYMAGIPVITTKWKYIPEIVSEDTGLLVSPYSVDELVFSIINIIENRNKLAYLKQGATKRSKDFISDYWNQWLIDQMKEL